MARATTRIPALALTALIVACLMLTFGSTVGVADAVAAPGALAQGAGYDEPRGSARVRVLQRHLRMAGEVPGPVDGLFGPRTEAAVLRFQGKHGLAVDGIVGRRTRAALRRRVARVSAPRPEPQGGELGKRESAPSRPAGPAPVAAGTDASRADPSEPLTAVEIAIVVAGLFLLASALLLLAAHRRSRRTDPPEASGEEPRPVREQAPAADDELPAVIPLASHRSERAPATNSRAAGPIPVLGYAVGQPRPGDGVARDIKAQAETIAGECECRGLSLMELVREREPERGSALERPGLGYALERIAAGEAHGVVVADLSRLTRSAPDLGRVLEWFSRSDARLVAAAEGLDSEDEGGRLAIRTLIQVSGWERERLAERTRQGMRAARRKGPPGVRDDPALSERIAGMRADGMTLQAIADRLNAEGVPTVRGGAKWRPSSVQAAAGYRRPRARARFDPPGRAAPGEARASG